MNLKFAQQPLCRLDGRPIRKRTETVYFDGDRPLSKAEAQRRVNQRIVSLRRAVDGSVYSVSTWDGETYEDAYFCTGECAKRFGYFAMEHPASETKKYHDAMVKAGRR